MTGKRASQPKLVALAGPNGAGKSTFYKFHLAESGLPFVNADEIARDKGCDAYTAAMEAEARRELLLGLRASFVFETVLSEKNEEGGKIDLLMRAADDGYDVTLVFIGLESWEQSEARVSLRVAKGGHDVPTEKLQERYGRTMKNLARAIRCLPRVDVYDNSVMGKPHRLIARYENGVAAFTADSIPAWFANILKDADPLDK